MSQHKHFNGASSVAAIAYAKRLAAEGKSAAQIGIMVRAAGFKLSDSDAYEVWLAFREHHAKVILAMQAGS